MLRRLKARRLLAVSKIYKNEQCHRLKSSLDMIGRGRRIRLKQRDKLLEICTADDTRLSLT
jgi:hypothetical protein